jgi:ketosteroid isomerase-like protein
MGRTNLEVIRDLYSAWSRGDFTVGGDDLEPNVTFVVRPPFPEFTVLVGAEAISRYMLGFLDQFRPGSLAVEANDLREEGDTVVAEVTQSGVGRASGLDATFRYFMLFTFRGGKIVRMESIVDEDEAMDAAGLARE